MASCMYRVGDYVYFEGNPTEPYLIRRIEELNKTPNGNVEARVACFYRRRDISSYLVNQVDRLKLDGPWDDEDEIAGDANGNGSTPSGSNPSSQPAEFTDTQKHQLRHRELFLTKQNETLLATNIRGKCLVSLHNETESFLSYLNNEDLFFYQLVYDPNQKTLNADRGEIRVGGKYQVDVPGQPMYADDAVEENPQEREELTWNASSGLTEKQIEQFLIVARSVGTFARALDCPTALKHPSLHMSAASASRDATLFFAMDTLHKHHYDLALATCSLVPNTGPILVKDQMEDWSAAEANSFEEAIEKCGKDFGEIQKEYLPWKSLKGIVEYYYMWKTTDRYVAQRRLKLAEQENKLKQFVLVGSNKAHQCLLPPRPQNESKPCESCGGTSSSKWYQWSTAQPNTRLCSECWAYYKKLGGLKYPKKSGLDRRQGSLDLSIPSVRYTTPFACLERAANVNRFVSYKCTVTGCEKDCKSKAGLQQHYAIGHGITVRSGSPRPLSKPRNTFSLYATPLTRAVRPFCPTRRLSRHSSAAIDIGDVRNQWEKHLNGKSADEIRSACAHLGQLYAKGKERHQAVRLRNLFPANNEADESKTFDDYLPAHEKREITDSEANVPVRYPKLLDDSSEFFAQFTHSGMSIMKKRPYESSENSNDGPSPKRTLISRQNLIKSKSPSATKTPRSRAYTVPFIDPPDGIYLRVTKHIKRLRKEIPPKEIRRVARAPWKKLNISSVSEHCQLTTPTSASPSSSSSKRLPASQPFLSTSSDFNTPSSFAGTNRNDSSSPQSHTSPIISDVCMSSQNGVRNASTAMKTKDADCSNGNHLNEKYSFTLDFSSPVNKTKQEPSRNPKSQHYAFDMSTTDEQDLHSPFELDVPICESQTMKKVQNDFLIDRMLKDESNSNYSPQYRSINQSSYSNVLSQPSPLATPSSDHHDIDALSDAGTYIIEDDLDVARDDEPEHDIEPPHDVQEPIASPSSTSSPFKRYAATKRNRHGTFDIHGIVSSSTTNGLAAPAVNRPIVDLNVPTHDLSSPSSTASSANLSSSSSLLSLPAESENSMSKEPDDVSHHRNDPQSSNGLVYARQRPNSLLPQRPSTPPQNQIKPAECFVISPTFDTKPFPQTMNTGPRRKLDPQWRSKLTTSAVATNDSSFETSTKKSPSSPPLSARSNQNEVERYSFRLRQHPRQPDPKPQQSRYAETKPQPAQPSLASNPKAPHHTADYLSSPASSKASTRPQPCANEQAYASPFQRNATIRQTMPANTQYSRPSSSSTTNKYLDDSEELLSTHPSLTKVYMNKSFALRRQRSNLVPTTAKSVQPPSQSQQQLQQAQAVSKALAARQSQSLKATTSIPASNNGSGQTNRAVELRRARAQAKIEELAQRTRHQLHKTEQHNDLMSASWHSNASSTSKKDLFHIRSSHRSNNNNHSSSHHTNTNNNSAISNHNHNLSAPRQDLSQTRTISSSSHHRSSSASPNPLGQTMTMSATTASKSSRYRKGMTSSVTDEAQYQRMHGSTFSEGERCDSLRDDGQRLAIKLIQLSSGILAKLKPNNIMDDSDSNVRELEQLVDQLQTVNRTLSTIDASLTGASNDEALI